MTRTANTDAEFEAWFCEAIAPFIKRMHFDVVQQMNVEKQAYRLGWQAARRAPAVPGPPSGFFQQVSAFGQPAAPQPPDGVCMTCNGYGAVGNPTNAEPCPDCTPRGHLSEAAPVQMPDDTDPLEDFQEGQWWVVELDKIAKLSNDNTVVVTADIKRAVAVVHHMLRSARYAEHQLRHLLAAHHIPHGEKA